MALSAGDGSRSWLRAEFAARNMAVTGFALHVCVVEELLRRAIFAGLRDGIELQLSLAFEADEVGCAGEIDAD